MTPTRSWGELTGGEDDVRVRRIVRDMATQTDIPNLFPPRSIPARAVNFAAGFPGTIGDTGSVAAGAILTAHIADSAVTSAKILDGTIATADLADSCVTTAKILDGTIATADLADGAVTPAKTAVIPGCRVYNNAAISVTHNTFQALTFNTERFDTDTMHSTSSNTGRITFTTAGIYQVTGHVVFAASAGGTHRSLFIRVDGSTSIASMAVPTLGASATVAITVTAVYAFTATQYVELLAYQDSGAGLNATATSNYSPEFGAVWIGKAV